MKITKAIIIIVLLTIQNASYASELAELAKADQAARTGKDPSKINWTLVAQQDEERRGKVLKILASDQDLSANDYFYAALIMQHGSKPSDYKKAMELAQQSIKIDPSHAKAKWLACASEDRYLIKIGEPQVWGTQLKRKLNVDKSFDVYYLVNFDKSARLDSARVNCGLPSLHEMEIRFEIMAKLPSRNEQYKVWKNGVQ